MNCLNHGDIGGSSSSSHPKNSSMKVKELESMGFSQENCVLALRRCGSSSTLETLVDFMVGTAELQKNSTRDANISYTNHKLMELLQQLTNCSLETARDAVQAYGNDPKYGEIDMKMLVMMDYVSASTFNTQICAGTGIPTMLDGSLDLYEAEESSGGDFSEYEEIECVPPIKKSKVVPAERPSFRQRKLTGFGVPGYPSAPARELDVDVSGPPFFYFENVKLMPQGEWNTISRHLFNIEPEFTDSVYFTVCRRQRGYVHNLPVIGRVEILPKAPRTIQELVPACREYWPSWDPRLHLNCLLPRMPTEPMSSKVESLMKPWSNQIPPLEIQAEILKLARCMNLVWLKPDGMGRLNVNEVEKAMGFDVDHTRSICSTRARFRCLGNAFQVHTVGYHLSVLRPLYPQGIKVLSLFAGIGGAEVALHKAGVRLNLVVSVESNDRARRVVDHWWASSKQSGLLISNYTDVRDLDKETLESLLVKVGGFDLVIGGSPCTDLSGLNRYHRDGLAGDASILFFEFPRILSQVREFMFK